MPKRAARKTAVKQEPAAPTRDKLAEWLAEIRDTDTGAALAALFARAPEDRALIPVGSRFADNGTYAVELPPGKYHVTISKLEKPPNREGAAPSGGEMAVPLNKSDLTAQAKGIVDQAAANAGPAHVIRLTVTGHTDTVGSDAYNMRLSRRRAESVAAQLEKDGIPSGEIEIVAKGKRDLLVPTADGVREPQNRRVQIVYDGGVAS